MPASRRTIAAAGLVLLGSALFPLAALAAALPAGFAAAPLWVSSAAPVAGDALQLFVAVNDTSTTTVSGAVSFSIDGSAVGSAKVSLAPGDAKLVSIPWTAVAGTHRLAATFDQPADSSGSAIELAALAAGPVSFVVSPAPPQPAALQYLSAAAGAVSSIGAPAAASVLAGAESLRESGAGYFASQLGAGSTSAAGQVLGTSTQKRAGAAGTGAGASPAWLDQAGYFVFAHPLVFYPFFVVGLFLALWLLLRLFSRSR